MDYGLFKWIVVQEVSLTEEWDWDALGIQKILGAYIDAADPNLFKALPGGRWLGLGSLAGRYKLIVDLFPQEKQFEGAYGMAFQGVAKSSQLMFEATMSWLQGMLEEATPKKSD